MVQPNDATTLSHHDAPWRRSRVAKRRRATSVTMAGVIHKPTSISVNATTTGIVSAITISWVMPVRKPAPSMDEIHSSSELTSDACSSSPRTARLASSQ